jgi:mono/diheme cytochrome c family protein
MSALIWWDARVRSAAEVPDLDAPARISAGRVVYETHCAACHGAQLEGQPNWQVRLPNGRLPAPPPA